MSSSGCSLHGSVELVKIHQAVQLSMHSASCASLGRTKLQRGERKVLRVMDTFIILIAGCIHRCKHQNS